MPSLFCRQKSTKKKPDAAHLQICRTYQKSSVENPAFKGNHEMAFLNCPEVN